MSKEARSSEHAEAPIQTHEIRDVQQLTCIVVGAGPAGAVLSLMLARKGIDVMLLESHLDFDRDFLGSRPSRPTGNDEGALPEQGLWQNPTCPSKLDSCIFSRT